MEGRPLQLATASSAGTAAIRALAHVLAGGRVEERFVEAAAEVLDSAQAGLLLAELSERIPPAVWVLAAAFVGGFLGQLAARRLAPGTLALYAQ